MMMYRQVAGSSCLYQQPISLLTALPSICHMWSERVQPMLLAGIAWHSELIMSNVSPSYAVGSTRLASSQQAVQGKRFPAYL